MKFERVFDGNQVMNIAFLTDDEKQNAEIYFPYKLNNKKSGYSGVIQNLEKKLCKRF